MLQHDSKAWASGRYVLVHPQGNHALAKLTEQYRESLTDDATFQVCTIEDMLDEEVLHTQTTDERVRERYLFANCPLVRSGMLLGGCLRTTPWG